MAYSRGRKVFRGKGGTKQHSFSRRRGRGRGGRRKGGYKKLSTYRMSRGGIRL